jgi:hypothetical protein
MKVREDIKVNRERAKQRSVSQQPAAGSVTDFQA